VKKQKLPSTPGFISALILVYLITPAFIQAQTSADQNPANPPQKAQDAGKEAQDDTSAVVKSYSLKYINASEVYRRASMIQRGEIIGNVLNVVVLKNRVRELDELIKQLDVEKKNILLRIYTVLASRKAPSDASLKGLSMTNSIDEPDLKRVLEELKGLWNFKSYRADSPQYFTVKDESGSNFFRMISEWPQFNLTILHPQVRGEEAGKRIIYIEQIQLKDPGNQNYAGYTIIDTHDLTFKEKGILVVGVGGMPMVGAVILIISAEIK
jgi:hypothetical protein